MAAEKIALWLQGQRKIAKAKQRAAKRRDILNSDRLKLAKCQSVVRMFLGVLAMRRRRERFRFQNDELKCVGRDRVLFTHQRLIDKDILDSCAFALELARERDEAAAAKLAEQQKGKLRPGSPPLSPRSPRSPRVGTPQGSRKRGRKAGNDAPERLARYERIACRPLIHITSVGLIELTLFEIEVGPKPVHRCPICPLVASPAARSFMRTERYNRSIAL